jgi:hypothetical protein
MLIFLLIFEIAVGATVAVRLRFPPDALVVGMNVPVKP